MRLRWISEDEFKVMEQRLSRDGVKVGGGKSLGEPVTTEGNAHRLAPPPKSLYDSKWEAAYHAKLQLEIQAGLIKQVWLHPFSLWLPGGVRYKPDFMIQYPDGMEQRLEIVEVKGWSRNRRDGITRLKIAAALFPCWTWRMVYRTKGGGWDGEYL
jgi:hypothetical protein